MKQITVISGKGGTGKTTITACLARLASNFVVADCDVDAADLHLLLHPKIGQKRDFYSGKKYTVDTAKCIRCGKCRELCRYSAINEAFQIDPIACDGCGACYFVCPAKAVSVQDNLAGEYYISSINDGITPFVHAALHIAEDNSGKLVSQVRKEARRMAEVIGADHIILDGPPGIGCPVNAAIVGVDLALVVTEPTLSGIHDLLRVIRLCQHFKVPLKVCINKSDINLKNCIRIKKLTKTENIEVIAEIPYEEAVIKALVLKQNIIEYSPHNTVSRKIRELWDNIK